jgi:hypothetical protein
MKVSSRLIVGPILAGVLVGGAAAQEKAPTAAKPPRILVIQREFLKPGKSGTAHEKTESAFVQAMARAKWPTHYLAVQSLSGKPRVLFFISYDSYEAWEKDTKAVDKNAALSAALDRANEADGALLDSADQNVFTYNEELSLRPLSDISHMRALEIWVAHVRPGHDKEWEDLNKLFRSAYEKAVPAGHWAVFEAAYGPPNGTYIFLTARKSAAELDRGPQEDKAVEAALGEEGMKKMNELFAAAVESSETQLFSFSAAMSYPPDEWVKADPDFWKPKPAAAPAAKTEKKPAAKP